MPRAASLIPTAARSFAGITPDDEKARILLRKNLSELICINVTEVDVDQRRGVLATEP